MKSFLSTIHKFIKQAGEGKKPKAKEYPSEYEGLQVEVSFNLGKFAHVPSIAFLYEGQTLSKGIYPAYIYYPKQETLILAYGISETKKPSQSWQLPPGSQTIKDYFSSNKLGIPERYGKSYVFKVYSPVSEIDSADLDKDLQQIIGVYKQLMDNPSNLNEPIASYGDIFNVKRLKELRLTGFLFSEDLLYRYAVSLLAKPFVILSGLSGSGKTQLALTFAKWMSYDDSQVKLIAVGADWNNREYLLGYPNALNRGSYIKPENGVLDFLLQASANPHKPYFLILDEMNLSYVERYFADFLSAMESKEPIHFHPATAEWNGCDVPAEVKLPPNLFITGTINVDETTYMFSPKVLDRANVIEFRITEKEMEQYLSNYIFPNPDAVNYRGADMGNYFVGMGNIPNLRSDKELNQILLSFFSRLKEAGVEFGYRTASEIYRFAALSEKLRTGWNKEKICDVAVMQKLLPKLHGSRKKLTPVLAAIWKLCLTEEYRHDNRLQIDSNETADDTCFRFPLSAAKVHRMYKNACDNGFTSYSEA